MQGFIHIFSYLIHICEKLFIHISISAILANYPDFLDIIHKSYSHEKK